MIVWQRPDGSANVIEDAERYDGMLDDGFPQAARPLAEIDRFLGDDWISVARERDELLIQQAAPDAQGMVMRTLIKPTEWLAAHRDGGIIIFDESELA